MILGLGEGWGRLWFRRYGLILQGRTFEPSWGNEESVGGGWCKRDRGRGLGWGRGVVVMVVVVVVKQQ